MRHPLLQIVIMLIAVAGVAAAPSEFDQAVLAAARKAQIPQNELVRAAESGLWNREKTAVAFTVKRPAATLALVLLRKANGEFLAVDVSTVENGNFRKLGLDRRRYEHFETAPVAWLPRSDGLLQVEFRTRVRGARQSHSVSEPLIIRPDGTPLWR